MPPRSKSDPIYEADPDAPQEQLPPPLGTPKYRNLLWIDDRRSEVESSDSQPVYIDTDD